MNFAVNLLWVRHNKVGGTESYVRNLLYGFTLLDIDYKIYLIVSEDNKDSFEEYFADKRFIKVACNVKSANVAKRILWENLHFGNILKKHHIHICFEPVYSKPILCSKKIKFITTIHDLQAWHYPEYQSKLRVYWTRYSWRNSVKSSVKIIAISDFVRNDIIERYHCPEKVVTINNPIVIDTNDVVSFDEIKKLYHVNEKEFYYTVSSLLPHKNLITLIHVMKAIHDNKINLPDKLLISGVGGKDKDLLTRLIEENGLTGKVVLTGFVENKVRNTLYRYSKAFLFPSIFEGFGMPPVEAMIFGGSVITTKKTSLYEVTQGKAIYVDDPYNVNEWVERLLEANKDRQDIDLMRYDAKAIAEKVYQLIQSLKED